MLRHRILALFVVIFISHLAFEDLNSEVKRAKSTSAPHSYPNQVVVPAKTQRAATSSNPHQNTVDALQVRRQYIDPILKQHWQQPIHCQKLIDDEQAFSELKEIYEKAIPLDKLMELPPDDRDSNESMRYISPDLERRIQEKTEGKMILGHPTRSTIKILAVFWEKYPCTESGLIALFKLNRILNAQTSYARVAQDETILYPYREFSWKLNDYILENYSECWETEILKRDKRMDYIDRYSEANAHAWEQWIAYVESHDVLNNTYYLYYTNSSPFDSIRFDYSGLFDIYARRCETLGQQGIQTDGKMPVDAIEAYQQYIALWDHVRRQYPEYYKPEQEVMWYGGSIGHQKSCYRLIETYAPQYKKH